MQKYIVENLIEKKGIILIENEKGERFPFSGIYIENEIVYLIAKGSIKDMVNSTVETFKRTIELEATIDDWTIPARSCLIEEGLCEEEIESADIVMSAQGIIMNLDIKVLFNNDKTITNNFSKKDYSNITEIKNLSENIVLIKTN